jgi:hypothetical protein
MIQAGAVVLVQQYDLRGHFAAKGIARDVYKAMVNAAGSGRPSLVPLTSAIGAKQPFASCQKLQHLGT